MFSYFLAVCPNQTILGKGGIRATILFFSLGLSCLTTVFYTPDIATNLTDLDVLYKSDEGVLLVYLAVLLLYALLRVVSIVRLRRGPLRPFFAS